MKDLSTELKVSKRLCCTKVNADPDIPTAHPRLRLVASFFLFGVLNNILYVIILSAALDLVPASTPKGLVAFFNIFPSLTTKLLWPYLSSGTVRYKRRMLVCTAASWTGMIVIATFNATALRLLGIGIASFSSGLGELSFLQLSTTLPTPSMSRDALGAWASGTGGAGIGGAALWWFLRSLGVSTGLGIASFLPFAFPAVFFLLLPRVHRADGHKIIDDGYTSPGTHSSSGFQPIFVAEDDDVSVHQDDHHSRKVALTIPLGEVVLTTREKIALAKPMVLRYMVPLFLVYAFEYIINAVSRLSLHGTGLNSCDSPPHCRVLCLHWPSLRHA
jgi:battenin